MVRWKKLSVAIIGSVFSSFALTLKAAHAHPGGIDIGGSSSLTEVGNPPSLPSIRGNQDFLVVSPDANIPSYSVADDRYSFIATGQDTDQLFSLFDFYIPPQAGPPFVHYHTRESESFYVLSGELTVQLEDKTIDAPTGSFVYLPLGRPHSFTNIGTTPADSLSFFTPSGIENFFSTLGQQLPNRYTPPLPPAPGEAQTGVTVAADNGLQVVTPDQYTTSLPGSRDFLVVPPGAPDRQSVSVGGGLYTSLATEQETGTFALDYVSLPPQAGSGEQPQINDQEGESFYILDGNLQFQSKGQSLVATPGTFVYFPKDTPFTFENIGMTQAKTLFFKISATSIPEPSYLLGVLGIGAYVGASQVLKRKRKKVEIS